jgi:type II secretory pathway component PulJ
MLAVIVLMAIVITVVASFSVDLSRQANASAEQMRNSRRAVVLLDRIARDLEGAVLVKKPGPVDPLQHPWLFLAEAGDEDAGADRVKFDTRNHLPRGSIEHEWDFAVVAYVLREAEDGEGYELLRWLSPQLPDARDLSFPSGEEDGAQVLADGIASFGMRFLGEEGEWQSSWDSSQVAESSALPIAAEIQLALLEEDEQGQLQAGEQRLRQVVLPLRPLDLDSLFQEEAAGDEEGGEESDEEDADGDGQPDEPGEEQAAACGTIAQCVDAGAVSQAFGAAGIDLLNQNAGQPCSAVPAQFQAFVKSECRQ